jgi:ubiquinone/menaquinone biosynthesis C-methylase UbiE
MHASDYSLGYSDAVLGFMSQRTADTHAAFFLTHLQPGWRVLDAGCGPGTITLGLARAVRPGHVTGVDLEGSQSAAVHEEAEREGLTVDFRKASIYELPFENESFDAVFSHAVFTHLSDPIAALIELRRVLKPRGVIGLRAGDLGGFLIDASSGEAEQAMRAYIEREKGSGKDPNIGRKLGRLLQQAGFHVQQHSASYEIIADGTLSATRRLAQAFMAQSPGTPSDAGDCGSLFVALAWCEAIGIRGGAEIVRPEALR